jgi:aerobic C4-dicarboxylate transport protein
VFINVLGNAVATIVIGKWEKGFDHEKAKELLSRKHHPDSTSLEAPLEAAGDSSR